ncbi:glycogen synthase GlgA [Ghiorsea bivora]|uniref:glycogen synthase GlgA n=1 Tax=Ghiorsea bivora TaxID=1485545 RepID=UPI0005704F29|nr:glycogen synthase GlgA [Ghiorsea bivora]
MGQLNIVFIASEATPLAKTGGLADVAGSLPLALQSLGHQVTVILPFYRQHLNQNNVATQPLNISIEMWVDGFQRQCPLHETVVDKLRFILVEQDDLFDREGIYGLAGGAYEDNLLRFTLFDRVALEAIAKMDAPVDIIHCHDWQTGMVPLLKKTQYIHHPNLSRAKTVYTIHNLAYQGIFPPEWIHRLGLPSQYFHMDGYEFHGQINCMKAGIEAAHALTTVSPTYAKEIMTPEYGCQLEGFLQHHADKLSGIVNGLDLDAWNPQTDTVIYSNFGAGKITGKKACKKALQSQTGLTVDAKVPLLTLISRLAEQKGIDLLLTNIQTWLDRGYQLAILGSGDTGSEAALTALAAANPTQMYFYQGFSESVAREIYAAGDMFLMPSRFEPCGLGQLMAMRYGNIPIVRATGGLKDTVVDYNQNAKQGTGFHFEDATPQAFDVAVEQAVAVFQKPATWARIRSRALKRDSSWQASAEAYVQLYTELLDD